MKKRFRILKVGLCAVLLTGCGIFPKEAELQKTPIIQAYEQEPFDMVQVQRGQLKLYEEINAVCMNLGEKQYTFDVNDMAFKGIYVTCGEQVKAGTVLAELAGEASSAGTSKLQLIAENDSTVTFVRELDESEKSISGQIIVVTNSNQGYYLNAFTKYWDKFKKGDQMVMRIRGKEYTATVVMAEDLGLSPSVRPEDSEEASEVYFYIEDQEAYLQSGDSGQFSLLVDEKQDVLYIPKGAVTTVNDKKIVYVENKDGIRSVQEIETGLETDRYVEVVSGLQEGDSIIVE